MWILAWNSSYKMSNTRVWMYDPYSLSISWFDLVLDLFYNITQVKWGLDLQSEHERYITENIFSGCPVIIRDYPKASSNINVLIFMYMMKENNHVLIIQSLSYRISRLSTCAKMMMVKQSLQWICLFLG